MQQKYENPKYTQRKTAAKSTKPLQQSNSLYFSTSERITYAEVEAQAIKDGRHIVIGGDGS